MLNEIGDMPLELQSKLLTFLDTRSFKRLGGEKDLKSDARIIVATNRDLMKGVAQGRFRLDLYYRLAVWPIKVPPLRERLEDIPMIARSLLIQLTEPRERVSMPSLDSSALEKLKEYNWPGNVRELRNVLERALVRTDGPIIGRDDIVVESDDLATLMNGASANVPPSAEPNQESVIQHAEAKRKPAHSELRTLYQEFIVVKGWSRAKLARAQGVDSSTLKKWFKEAGLPAGQAGRPRKSSQE